MIMKTGNSFNFKL